MSMPDHIKQELAERRREKRDATAADRFAKSRRSLRESLRRDRARTDGLRIKYFRDRYGDRWQQAMARYVNGSPVPTSWRVS